MKIVLNKTQTRRMLKVKGALEDMWDGNLRKYHVTPNEAYEIGRIYNNIVTTHEHTDCTISENVKSFFEKRGFNIMPEGIGWYIGILNPDQSESIV